MKPEPRNNTSPKHSPYSLVIVTCWGESLMLHTVCVFRWYICLWVTVEECIELALVKNTERWVSLPRIQIGNLGDLRNAPTWNTRTHEKTKLNVLRFVLFFIYKDSWQVTPKNSVLKVHTKDTIKVLTAFLLALSIVADLNFNQWPSEFHWLLSFS